MKNRVMRPRRLEPGWETTLILIEAKLKEGLSLNQAVKQCGTTQVRYWQMRDQTCGHKPVSAKTTIWARKR